MTVSESAGRATNEASGSAAALGHVFAAAPIVLALHAGRLADRHGYHRPLQLAVALSVAGGGAAVLATFVAPHDFLAVCLAAVLAGAGANLGLITIQRTPGRTAKDATELKRVFSWLGLAPALSNVAGPVMAGAVIVGFRTAFVALTLLPLLALPWARRVPREAPRCCSASRSARCSR